MDLSQSTVKQLKAMLQLKNLPTHGKKADLIVRLETEKGITKPKDSNKNDAASKAKSDSNKKKTENPITRMTRSKAKHSEQQELGINGAASQIDSTITDTQMHKHLVKRNIKICKVILERIDVTKYQSIQAKSQLTRAHQQHNRAHKAEGFGRDLVNRTEQIEAAGTPARMALSNATRMLTNKTERNRRNVVNSSNINHAVETPSRITRSQTQHNTAEKSGQMTPISHLKVTEKRQLVNTSQSTGKKRRIEAAVQRTEETVQIVPTTMGIRKKKQKKLVSSVLCLKPSLHPYEMVWAHVRGYANWPGIIENETKSGKYTIHFFGDYTKCDVTKSKIMHLMEGFDHFTMVERPSAALTKAINEAKFFIFDKDRSSCPICDMLIQKQRLAMNRALTN